jgi:glycosyltransferase involved in cell wall biosynthesis
MIIGIDACCWSNRRGFGRFTRELLKALASTDSGNQYVFFADRETAEDEGFPAGVKIVSAPTSVAPTTAASATGRRSLRDLWALSREVLKYDLDLFFFPAVYSYFPILNRTKVIVTLHDMIADHHPNEVFPNKKLRFFWKAKQNLAVRQADLILTVSDSSKRAIVDYFNLEQSRVQTIPEGPSAVFSVQPRDERMREALSRFGLALDDRFLLYVGGISPHKNLGALIDAFHQVTRAAGLSDLKLVLVGDYKDDPFYSDYPFLRTRVNQLGLGDRVMFTGFVQDRELVFLYSASSLLVMPSLEEGFGLPVIEAMSCGTPAVCSQRGSLPEVLGEAGSFFDPARPESLARAILEVLADDSRRSEMARLGLDRSRQFTWEAAATKTAELFARTIANNTRRRQVNRLWLVR